jgi:transposase
MFLKVTRSKNRFYLQLVQSYREGKKTRHKIIANLGSHDQLEGNPLLLSLGRRLLKVAGEPMAPSSPIEMEELGRYCYGHIVYRKIWDKLDISVLVKQILRGRRIRFDFANTLYLLSIDRLLSPQSKRGSYLRQERYFDIQPIELHQTYRMLEVLADCQERIEHFLFHKQAHLFNLSVDVVFYDITTFHFESVRPDQLKDFGFSKAGKFNEVQVLLGLLVDSEGRPIGFDLYPGNTFEGATLVDALDKLKQRFEISKVVFVADKGLNSGENLHLIRQAGYEYIVACPARRKGKQTQEAIFDSQDYTQTVDTATGEITFKYKWLGNEVVFKKEVEGKKQKITFEDRILVSWTAKRAERDRINRERHLVKAQKMIDQKTSPSSKKGAARFLQTSGKEKVIGLNQDKIKEEEKWDGFHTIQTNAELTHQQVLENYHTLWKIENAFRVLKSTMETRPIFHWTPKRIQGHFVLSFIAFLLERSLEIKLQKNQIALSPEKIKETLNSIELSKVRINQELFWLKAKPKPPAAKILKAMRIKQPNNLTPLKQIAIE